VRTLKDFMEDRSIMSRKRQQPERDTQDRILGHLKAAGVLAFHIPNHGMFNKKTRRYNQVGKYHVAGVPDLAVVIPGGRIVWVEVKSMTGSQAPEQKAFQARLELLGHDYIIARRLEDVIGPLRRLGVAL
jgi:hypothetical protein